MHIVGSQEKLSSYGKRMSQERVDLDRAAPFPEGSSSEKSIEQKCAHPAWDITGKLTCPVPQVDVQVDVSTTVAPVSSPVAAEMGPSATTTISKVIPPPSPDIPYVEMVAPPDLNLPSPVIPASEPWSFAPILEEESTPPANIVFGAGAGAETAGPSAPMVVTSTPSATVVTSTPLPTPLSTIVTTETVRFA